MRRNWLIAAIVLGIVSIAVAALAMRLSEEDARQTSPAAWADSVCASLSTWRSSITSLAEVGDEPLTRESLQDRLTDARSATSQLVTELQSLGAPDLESGDQLREALEASAGDIESSFDELRLDAEAARTADSPAAFIQALAALAPQFQALLDTISTTVADLRNADVADDVKEELRQAFANAASCQDLQA